MQKEDRKYIEPLPWRSAEGYAPPIKEVEDSRACVNRILTAAKQGLPAYSAINRPEKCSIQEISDPSHGRWGHVAHLILHLDGSYGVELADSHNLVLMGVGGLPLGEAIKLFKWTDSDISSTGIMAQHVRDAYYGKDAPVAWEKASKLPEKVASGEKSLADGTKRDPEALRKSLINKRLRSGKQLGA